MPSNVAQVIRIHNTLSCKCVIHSPTYPYTTSRSRRNVGSIAADLIDPHGAFLADALPKLKGLAAYAASHEGVYRRIEAIDEFDGQLKSLDLTNPDVRKAIEAYEGDTAAGFYQGEQGQDYPV